MARRAPAADSTEDHLASVFSGALGDYVEQHGSIDVDDDEISSHDSHLDTGSLGTLAALVGAGFEPYNIFDSDEEDEDYLYDDEDLEEELAHAFGEYDDFLTDESDEDEDEDDQTDSSTPLPALLEPIPSEPTPAISQPGRDNSQGEGRPSQSRPQSSRAPVSRLPLGLSLNNENSAINIDDDDDDDLEFLGQNDFSSPSILNDNNTPSHSLPARRNVPSGLNTVSEAMPQTRRRTAEERAASVVADPFPLPLPANPAAAAATTSSNATPGRPRTRSRSNSFLSPRANIAPASRTSHKRRRSGEAGSSGTTLPPIADLLASVGNSSGSSSGSHQVESQASSSSSSSVATNRPQISPKRPRREEAIILDDDLFGSDDDGDAGVQMVNLVDVDRPQAVKAEGAGGDASQKDETAAATATAAPGPKKTLVRLSAQQCVICMDNMTNLTTTHCGHIFCGECLHASLSMESARRICPICRTKVEMRVPNMAASRLARSVFPLQLKMRARNQKGKQLDSSY
ncbi:hypothetical protein SBRCBS47491_010028 [Sporothrix bragantina]|uniref:RING-type domain-containing protein n=1 Tax=Sporothrix bragantina TaxID=671064 RepID=A0ABP0D058_9PEZI